MIRSGDNTQAHMRKYGKETTLAKEIKSIF